MQALRRARTDKFHWQLMSRPAELLDLDSMVLMRLTLNAGYRQEEIMDLLGWGLNDVLRAPLDVAESLKRTGRDRGLEFSP